ncbi:MAG: class I SAM-dependent DNA methyltransferase [Bacteroidota bacterium]
MVILKHPLYNEFAEKYDLMFFEDKYYSEVNFIEKLRKEHELNKKLIDLGCGTGSHIYLFNEYNYRCTGVDISEKMLGVAEKKSPESTFYLKDITSLSFQNEFDLVTCLYGAINYIDKFCNLKKAIENIHKLCKKKSLVFIDCIYGQNLPLGVEIENESGRIKINQWQKIDEFTDLWKFACIIKRKDLFFFEKQKLFFQNPFLIAELMKESGFDRVQIYNSRFQKFNKKKDYESMLVGFKYD